MYDFKVGQKVVCVDIEHSILFQPLSLFLIVGNIYTIRWIGKYKWPWHKPGIGVRLVEVDGMNRDDMPFLACRFRPLVTKKTSIEVFKRLLLPIKTEELV